MSIVTLTHVESTTFTVSCFSEGQFLHWIFSEPVLDCASPCPEDDSLAGSTINGTLELFGSIVRQFYQTGQILSSGEVALGRV